MGKVRFVLLGVFIIPCALLLPCSDAVAQPTLESLWPNGDGLRWDYEFAMTSHFGAEENFTAPAMMQLLGTAETAGGTAQILIAEHGQGPGAIATPALEPLLRAVWRARPDLRTAILARYGSSAVTEVPPPWYPLFLHPGCFMKDPTKIQMWRPDWNQPAWTYLEDNLTPGATFTQQLVPELADDVYLHGTVEAVDVTVTTQARTYEHAVRMGYVIDYGWGEEPNPDGDPVSFLFRTESRGHVHYVPDVGPVELLEDFLPYVQIDCGTDPCPPEWTDHLGQSAQTLTLSLVREPVAVDARSWTEIKQLYRNR
jgi:hypothetical protein